MSHHIFRVGVLGVGAQGEGLDEGRGCYESSHLEGEVQGWGIEGKGGNKLYLTKLNTSKFLFVSCCLTTVIYTGDT